jgi:accessory gene regulator B
MSIKLAVCMDKLLDKIIAFTYKDKTVEPDHIDIVRYGLEMFIFKAIFMIISLFIAILISEQINFIIYMLFFIPLRSLAGGYHAPTRLLCFIESMAMVLIVCITAKFFTMSSSLAIIFYILAIPSILYILIKSPVEDKNKPLDSSQVNSFRKKIGICILSYLLFIVFLNLINKIQYVTPILFAIFITSILILMGLIKNKHSEFVGE